MSTTQGCDGKNARGKLYLKKLYGEMPGPCQVENHPNFPSVAACLVGSAFQHRKGQLLPVAISKSHMRARASNQEKATFTGHCATNLSKACGGGGRLRQFELAPLQLQVLQIHSPGVALTAASNSV